MLHLHTAGRIEPLAERLAEVLSAAPADPMAPEWIAVPSEGMRRWLHLELARHLGAGPGGGDGIAANIVSSFPDSLRQAVVRAGADDGIDPWQVEHLVWAVLAGLAASDDPQLVRLADVPTGASRLRPRTAHRRPVRPLSRAPGRHGCVRGPRAARSTAPGGRCPSTSAGSHACGKTWRGCRPR